MFPVYDVIVVGGGHAGCEAAAAAANMGSFTLLITMDMTKFGNMSCNPAMGGIAKGQIIREIDALGGYSGILSDKATIQFRMLNKSKGPAMWSPRAQIDRVKFSEYWRNILENLKNLDLWQDTVVDIMVEEGRVKGVVTKIGVKFVSKSVILTAGTFLNGIIHIGTKKLEGGRIGEASSFGISEKLSEEGIKVDRLKTGTPVRMDGRNIDFSKLTEQKGENDSYRFSFLDGTESKLKQRSCWITHTTPEVHDILRTGFNDSPLYTGRIKGTGPRYCPSIETKLVTFAGKEQHQLFIEPEGENTNEYYLNGFSSSLPWEVQYKALRKIPGLEDVKIYRPGYAIEYDYFDPTQLKSSLETKNVENLFFAGQINGTTGYEEAGAQGIIAGINAHLKVSGAGKNFYIGRNEAYIGVLIDDLVTKGVDEPYRMFTSRAEFRILLRQDNADERLTLKSFNTGLADKERYERMVLKTGKRDQLIEYLKNFSIKPLYINELLNIRGTSLITQPVRLKDILLRPQISIWDLAQWISPFGKMVESICSGSERQELLESAEILVKYDGYISREQMLVEKMERLEHLEIPRHFDYSKMGGISTEARQKLTTVKPATLGQATRIPGVSPADINVLLIMMGR